MGGLSVSWGWRYWGTALTQGPGVWADPDLKSHSPLGPEVKVGVSISHRVKKSSLLRPELESESSAC